MPEAPQAHQLDALVNLAREFRSPNVFNPWRDSDPLDAHGSGAGPTRRCIRLRQHFECAPRYLLIGEAPGYQGCHFSGVPFTNEALLCDGSIPRMGRIDRITTRPRPWREPSATIVWKALYEIGIAQHVVMWNAFAWHPHEAGSVLSNSTPSAVELSAGKHVLEAVVRTFADAEVIAVGNVPAALLTKLGIPFAGKVRHPSMGGASEFRAGLRRIVEASDARH